MGDKPQYLQVFSLLLILLAAGCADREKGDKATINSSTSSTLGGYSTLAETRTTLLEDMMDRGGVSEIEMLVNAGKLDDALNLAQKNATPQVLVYLNNAGVNYTREKRYEQAEKIFSAILRIDPNQPDVWYNKGLVDADLGRHEDAIVAYGKATELRPTDAGAWYQKASSLYYLNRYEEAVEACNRSVALDPKNPYAWYNMGIGLTELKRYNESIRAYEMALSIKPDYAEAENNRGNVLSELGRYREALEAYDRALAIRADEQTKKNRNLAEAKLKEAEGLNP